MVPNVPYLNVMDKVTSPDYTPTTEGKLQINSLIRMDFLSSEPVSKRFRFLFIIPISSLSGCPQRDKITPESK